MEAVSIGAASVREEAREVGATARALLDAGFDATTGRRELEATFVAMLSRSVAAGEEFGQQGAAFETMLHGIFDFRVLIFDWSSVGRRSRSGRLGF